MPERPRKEALDLLETTCLQGEVSVDLLALACSLDETPGPFAARARFLHGNVLYRLDRDEEALAFFRQAEAMAIQEGDPRTQALAVVRQVEWAIFHKRWEDAEARWQESLLRCDRLGEPYQRARPRQARGQILRAARRWGEAVSWYEEAASLYAEAGYPREQARCSRQAREARLRASVLDGVDPGPMTHEERVSFANMLTDEAFEQSHEPERALALAARALAMPELPGWSRGLLLASCCDWWLALGDIPRAREALDAARSHPSDDEDFPDVLAMSAVALALITGEPLSPEQENLLLSDPRSLELDEEGTRLNRAILWMRKGAAERALAELDTAVAVVNAMPEERLRSLVRSAFMIHVTRAHCLFLLDRGRQAIEALEEAGRFEDQVSPMDRALLRFRRAFLLHWLEEYPDAQDAFLEVLDLFPREGPRLLLWFVALAFAARSAILLPEEDRRIDYPSVLSEVLGEEGVSPSAQALLLHARGLLTRSVEDLSLASEKSLDAGIPVDAADILDDAVILLFEQADQEKALSLSRRTAAILDELLLIAPDDESRVGLSSRVRALRARRVALLWEHTPEEAFAEIVWAKSAALLALLSLRLHARPDHPVLPCSRGYPAGSPERWLAQAGDPLALRMGPPPALDLEAVRRLYREITSTDAVAIQLAREHAVSAPAILAAIPEDAALVEWFTFGGELFGFLVRPGRLHSFRLSLPDAFDEYVDSVRLIARQGGAVPPANRRLFRAALRRLHEVLIAPWLEQAAGASRLFLCPDGRLSGVPFAALGAPEGPALLDRFELAWLLSASQLTTAPPPARGAPGVFALVRGEDGAHPLPWATAELESLADLGEAHGWSVRKVEAGARLADVERALRGATVWHFAGHAGFVEEQGMAAYLATPERSWTAAEILGLDLRGLRLAVLSACETGRTSEALGDERVGLLRALHAAGVESLVCSSWPAADASTARLATLFYERWFRGERASSALRHAQIQLRGEVEDDPSGFPWSWANFAVYGVS
jgi:CHAT domain-containing protein/tetratricopeptide (TPR) repeat protein